MKKKVLFGAMSVALLGGGFVLGDKIGASSDWKNEVVSQAQRDLTTAAYYKTEELLGENGIGDQMKMLLSPEIDELQRELERLLEEYYLMKIQGLTSSPEFAEIQKRLEEIMQGVVERYKGEIDEALGG